eukprot:superscaffoldBa00001995_g12787
MFGGLAIKGVWRLGPSVPARHSLLAREESSSSGQGHRLQLGRRSFSYNRSVNRGGRTYSSCTMLRKDRRNPGPPTGNWQFGGGCQWAAMVRQYTNSRGRGYSGCQLSNIAINTAYMVFRDVVVAIGLLQEREKESGVAVLVSQYSSPAQDTITPLLLKSEGLSVGSFLRASFQVFLGPLPETCPIPQRQAIFQTDRKSALSVCEVRGEEEVMSDGSRSELSYVSTYGSCGVQCKGTKQGVIGQPWERIVDKMAQLAVPRAPMGPRDACSGESRTLKDDKGQLEKRRTLHSLARHNGPRSTVTPPPPPSPPNPSSSGFFIAV